MLWCKARFEHSSVEVNQVNTLKVEIFSKLSKNICIESVELYTNIRQLNQTVDMMIHYDGGESYGHNFNRATPITIEREFLIDSESTHHEIWLNQVKLKLHKKGDEFTEVTLSLSPYLAPTTADVKRLPPPVNYEIVQQPD